MIFQTEIKGGGTQPTGTKSITSNGVYDVTDFASADVQVPTTAPSRYLQYDVDANGMLIHDPTVSSLINLNGVTDVGQFVLAQAYGSNITLTGLIDLSNFTSISSYYACYLMFENCTGITSVDLSSLKIISGQQGCGSMFQSCAGITSADLSSLIVISGQSACSNMFYSCTNLTNLKLDSLYWISSNNTLSNFAAYCSSLTNIGFDSLTYVSNLGYCFPDSGITSLSFPKLCKIGGSLTGLGYRAPVTSISFGGLVYTNSALDGFFNNMLTGVDGCTVHFPAEWQTTMSAWTSVTNGFGGTNTTVLFDLPNVSSTLDLTKVTEVMQYNQCNNFAGNNYFVNTTSVDLSNLTTIQSQYGCGSMFQNSTVITSINLSSLKEVTGSFSCQQMCQGCTGLTSLSFPALNSTSFGSYTNQFSNIIRSITGCTLHFPKNLDPQNGSTVISRLTGYPNFGGTSTVISFDLPSTVILTGADTVEYERNPKNDTATALAWRINGTMPDIATTYYTSGLTDPAVGGTIYSDAACTTAVTTISSIA